MVQKMDKIKKAKQSFYPLFRKGDEFKIVGENNSSFLMPIEAMHLKSGEVYGFEEWELE